MHIHGDNQAMSSSDLLVVLNSDSSKCCERIGNSRHSNLWASELDMYGSNVYGKIAAASSNILSSLKCLRW